jgi:anti-sigma regulatory factor (Ser/Thr protein kinase)
MLASARCCGGRGLSAWCATARGGRHDRGGSDPAPAAVFPGAVGQVARARLFIGNVLDGCPAADDAILLTSELVTNAIAHTASGKGGKVIVTVYRADTRVRVEVKDNGFDQAPIVRPVGEARESGFGLELVELIADRWGHCGGRRSRVVWFMLDWKTNS